MVERGKSHWRWGGHVLPNDMNRKRGRGCMLCDRGGNLFRFHVAVHRAAANLREDSEELGRTYCVGKDEYWYGYKLRKGIIVASCGSPRLTGWRYRIDLWIPCSRRHDLVDAVHLTIPSYT